MASRWHDPAGFQYCAKADPVSGEHTFTQDDFPSSSESLSSFARTSASLAILSSQRIMRQTISNSIARTLGLPLLLTLPDLRFPPLLCSRGHSPV